MSRTRSARAGLVAGAVLVALLLAELALRTHAALSWRGSLEAAYRNPEMPPTGRKATLGDMVRPSPHERLVYELKPGLEVIFRGVPVRTNDRGWREGAVETAAKDATVRILGLGDSTMFGWGVPEESRYLDLLERRLRETFPETHWQAIVTAVPGYNLMMQIESLKRYGRQLAPDLVVYGWDPNDQCLPHFLLRHRGFFEPELFLMRSLKGTGARDPQLRPKERLRARCRGEDVPTAYRPIAGREPFEEAVDQLARFSTEEGVPVALLEGLGVDFESAMALSPPAGLHRVEAGSPAAAEAERDLVLSRSDPHPSELGHRLLAEALFEQLSHLWPDLGRRPTDTSTAEDPTP